MLKTIPASLPIRRQQLQALKEPKTDRRQYRRYPIVLDLIYKSTDQFGGELRGAGTTLNMSTGGVLFQASDVLIPFRQIEMSLQWPFLLQDVCPLRLYVRGRVVRSRGYEMAVRIDTYEFRTAGPSRKYGA